MKCNRDFRNNDFKSNLFDVELFSFIFLDICIDLSMNTYEVQKEIINIAL